jgi:hypothetical protein
MTRTEARLGRGRVLILTICLVILAAVCGREAWGYVEAQRFHRLVEAIAARGEPTNEYRARERPPGGGTGTAAPHAARHYAAAAELLIRRPEWNTAVLAGLRAAHDGTLGDTETRGHIAAFAVENADALRLVRDARTLPFHGFRLPRRFHFSPDITLSYLLPAAAMARVAAGDGDGALAHVGDLIGLLRTTASEGSFGMIYPGRSLEQAVVLTGLTLRLAPPSSAALAELDTLLTPAAEMDTMARSFQIDRALFIDQVWQHLRTGRSLTDDNWAVSFAQSPWLHHRINGGLERFNLLVAAARTPWSERLEALDAAARRVPRIETTPLRRGLLRNLERLLDSGHHQSAARHAARQAIMARVLRTVVAIELYRRLEQTLPDDLADLGDPARVADPLAASPLQYRREQDGYVVYGVGANGQDDGGDLGVLTNPHAIGWWIPPDDAPDWGLRVRLPDAAPTQ